MALRADLRDVAALRKEVNLYRADAVVHLAAVSYVAHEDATDFYRTNVVGTFHLLSILAESTAPPNKVLLASSANVYGNCAISPIAETQLPAPVNHYAMSKLAMEHMSAVFADRLTIMTARPFNYTGPGQASQFLIPKLVQHFATRKPFIELGNVHVQREFNDVRMICQAYLKMLDYKGGAALLNVCTGKTYSITDVLGKLEIVTGHRLHIRINPDLVRVNEVDRLCGDPSLLHQKLGTLTDWALEATLSSMLEFG